MKNALCLAHQGVMLPQIAGTEGLESPIRQYRAITLDIFTESVILTRYSTMGVPTHTYEVHPSALAAALANVPWRSGLLPPGTIYYGHNEGGVVMAVYLPPQRRELSVLMPNRRLKVSVPLPPLIFAGAGVEYYVVAVEKYPQAKEVLYRAPVPNVGNNGKICSGTLAFPVCAPETIMEAVEMFFDSDFNRDLSEGKVRGESREIIDYWSEISLDSAAYPADTLVPMRPCIEDFIERIR
ncbi:MAG: hypothetical protein JXB35_10510 [Anaerolineae bacterium]|nr:hypothetical protein [Anaerolineae bacterium]